MALLKLDYRAAWEANSLTIPLFVGILVYMICRTTDRFFHGHITEHIDSQLKKTYMWILYGMTMVLVTIINNI